MKKIISAITAAALMLTSAETLKITDKSVCAENDTLKIMCIGDSITDGYVSEYVGSYRKFIYHNLTEMGYSVDMVGTKDGGWTPTYTDSDTGESFEFDNENTGYSGYSVQSYSGRNGIYEKLVETDCLKKYAPDIVTLQIGTNDVIDNYEIDTAGNRLKVLVDYILKNISDDSVLFVTTIPDVDPNRSDVYSWFGNYRHSADWQTQYTDEQAEQFVTEAVSSYNSQVKQIVNEKMSQGENIFFADVNSVATDVKTQLFDGVHPNNKGYKAIGDYWTGVLDEYLKNDRTENPTEPLVTTEAPVTTAQSTSTTDATTSTAIDSTTPPGMEADKFTVSDLVKMSRYLLGCTTGITYTGEEIAKYDLNKDGKVDVYDLVLGRRVASSVTLQPVSRDRL